MSGQNQNKFLLVDLSVLPEVFARVVEAKRLLESERAITVQDGGDLPQCVLQVQGPGVPL